MQSETIFTEDKLQKVRKTFKNKRILGEKWVGFFFLSCSILERLVHLTAAGQTSWPRLSRQHSWFFQIGIAAFKLNGIKV